MAKLRKKHNKSLVILIPVLILVVFAMFLTYSFANFKIVKIFDIVAAHFIPVGTGPTFTAKNVQSDYVYLTFDANISNVQESQCYYGTSSSNVSTLAEINDSVCRVPVNASYAKICVTVNNTPICSENKKLAEYVIEEGVLKYPFQPTDAEVVPSQGTGYYHVEIGNNSRLGIQLTGFDATLYNTAYVDLSYIIDASANRDPGISFFGFGTGSFFTRDGTDKFFESSLIHLEKQSEPVRVEQPRTIYPVPFIVDTSNSSVYGNANIGIGKNAVGTNEFVLDIYNMWFQLRD